MTLKHLREKIKSLSEEKQEELNSIEVLIDYPHLNIKKNLKGILNIYRFVQKQDNGWSKLDQIPEYLETSKIFFSEILEKLDKHLLYNYGNSNSLTSQRDFKDAIQYLTKNSYDRRRGYGAKRIFTYDASQTIFLLDLQNINPNSIDTATQVILKEDLSRVPMNFDNFIGIQKAFEFLGKGKGEVRLEAEAKSIQLLRDDFYTQIVDSRKKLEITIEEYEVWLKQTQEDFNSFDQQTKQTIKDNELLYGEKLKLEKPADYWQKRAIKLENEGKKWLFWLIGASITAVISLIVVLYFISDGTLKELFAESGSAIRWSIVFIALISFLAFCIRTFAKLMFSAYHLARDAEEREQLAYVYLALINDKNIEEAERHLVLQSLFSRSDSGLLKSDTSPTMPGNIVDKFVK